MCFACLPQFSVSTSGSSLRLLEQLLKSDPVLARVRASRGRLAAWGSRRAGIPGALPVWAAPLVRACGFSSVRPALHVQAQ